MGMYAVQTADASDLGQFSGAAQRGREVAAMRRRALSQGKQALNGNGAAPPPVATDGEQAAPVAASNGHGASNGAAPAPAVPTDAVGAAHFGRDVSKQRRRALSQGKQALHGVTAPPAATNGAPATPAVASNGQGVTNGEAPAPPAPAAPRAPTDAVAAAHFGRDVSKQRRRALSQGKQALQGVTAPPAAPSSRAPATPSAPTDAVAAAHFGRDVSKQRRRALSQGKQALQGVTAPPAATTSGTPAAPAVPTDPVAAAHFGRDVSKQRRRALSQGKQALQGVTAPPAAPAVQAPVGPPEGSRPDRGGAARPQSEGQIAYPYKVLQSPTHGGQQVTGLRIGPGVRVTGDEAGSALPVSGTQYVAADGPPAAPGAGRKVGLARTPQGLIVSGTTVRNKVPITGDEFGEHLPITGEADQKLDDDLTPRGDGDYRSAQFPRRADPHGASALGTRLGTQRGPAPATEIGPARPLETTTGGLPVTGTAVGRSGRVTGNEAGSCRPITGDQYAALDAAATECGGTGGGTAPAAQMNQARLDPVTLGKVTVAQTWSGQRVTGPSVEHRPNVTGDEPGTCRPLTGTPYQGPSSAFGWCEPGEGGFAAQRLDPRPPGVGVTGDVPMHAKAVTGTERGRESNVTGTPYYSDLRTAEPAADDWTGSQQFPIAWARRLAGGRSDNAPAQEKSEPRPAPSSVPGCITGSFSYGDGKVTGNQEFLFRARPSREGNQPTVTGEGSTEGRTVTGSAWKANSRVTGTEGYIAARRNPSEGGGAPHGWTGARKFRDHAVTEGPRQIVTGLSGWSPKAAAKITLSGGAQG